MICGSGGWKSRLAKAAGAEPSGHMRDGKLHAVVARSTFASEKANAPHVRNTFGSCDVEKVQAVWRRAHFQVKMYKTHQLRSTFGSCDVEKVHAVVARSIFPSQNVKNSTCSDHFWRFRCGFACRCTGFCTLPKLSKTWRFCSMSKKDGASEEDLERCISRGRRGTRNMPIRDVRRSGRWFPDRGCILEHQIFSFGKMILHDRRSTSYDLASLFRVRRSTWHRRSGKITKRIGTRRSALHSTFHFEGSLAELLHFEVLKFENWENLAKLLRLWCCQVQKLRKSRRLAALLMLSSSKVEEVSQNCCGFKLADRQVDR